MGIQSKCCPSNCMIGRSTLHASMPAIVQTGSIASQASQVPKLSDHGMENKMYELIKDKLDWTHEGGYCVSYTVTYWAAEWSTGKYWIVTGVLPTGGIIDLGQYETYLSQYAWLSDCIGTHVQTNKG
jgi:hypothetical protein